MCGHEWKLIFNSEWKTHKQTEENALKYIRNSITIMIADKELSRIFAEQQPFIWFINVVMMFYSGGKCHFSPQHCQNANILVIVSEISNFCSDFVGHIKIHFQYTFTEMVGHLLQELFNNNNRWKKQCTELKHICVTAISIGIFQIYFFFCCPSISCFSCDLSLCSHMNCNLTNE